MLISQVASIGSGKKPPDPLDIAHWLRIGGRSRKARKRRRTKVRGLAPRVVGQAAQAVNRAS